MDFKYPEILATVFSQSLVFDLISSENFNLNKKLEFLQNTNYIDSINLLNSFLAPTMELSFTLPISFSESSIVIFDITEQLLRSHSKFNLLPSELQNYDTIKNPLKLTHEQFVELIKEVDEIDDFETISNIRSMYLSTIPNVKLFYPEPFLAAPSFMHNDLGFLHILQYQF